MPEEQEEIVLQDWEMAGWIEEHCENIDAAFFTGDSMLSPSTSKKMREYIERWTLQLNDKEKGQRSYTWLPAP